MNTKTITTAFLLLIMAGTAFAQTATQTGTDTGPSTRMEATLINTDPVPVRSGEDAEIFFKVRNTGDSEADNVQVTIPDSYPFRLKPDTRRSYDLGTLEPGHEYYITAEVLVAEDAPDGANDLRVRISNENFNSTRDVEVQVQNQDIELNLANLRTVPSRLTPDVEDAKLQVETVNNGEKTAENVVIDLNLPEGFESTSSFSTRQSLGNLAPGQVKMAEFTFDTLESAEAGEVSIPANVTYSTGDSTSEITESVDFSFYLSGRPQFEVVETDSDLSTGSRGQLEVTVRNVGDEESSSTRIRVLDSADQPFSYSSSSSYIGTLEPGQNGTAVFDITTESMADSKQYLLDFEIRGVRGSEVYVEDSTIPVQVESSQRESSSFPVILFAVIPAVIILLAFVFRDRIRERMYKG